MLIYCFFSLRLWLYCVLLNVNFVNIIYFFVDENTHVKYRWSHIAHPTDNFDICLTTRRYYFLRVGTKFWWTNRRLYSRDSSSTEASPYLIIWKTLVSSFSLYDFHVLVYFVLHLDFIYHITTIMLV